MLKSSQQTLYQEGLSQFLVISTVSLPSCTPHGEWICLQNNGAVFCPHHVLEPASNQYCISLLLDFPPVDEDCVFVLYFSPSFFVSFCCFCFFSILFLFFSVTRSVCASLSHHIHTHTRSPVSHFHYKTEWIWATAWITSPHLAFIHFPEGSQGFSFFLFVAVGTVVNVWAHWLCRVCRVRTVSGRPPFRTTHSLPLFPLISGRTCLTG